MPANVWVLAIKQAESAADTAIIRVQERMGAATTASLKSSALGLDHKVALKPWELKTLAIRHKPGTRAELREVSLLEV